MTLLPQPLAFACLLAGTGSCLVAAPALSPTSPPSLSVRVDDVTLAFDPPVIETFTGVNEADGKVVPVIDHRPALDQQDNWKGAIRLTPKYDATRTLILGNFFRTFRPETLRVRSADGTTYERDRDFVFESNWGLIANKDGRMKDRVTASAEGALQRLDLVQINASGKPSVKKGASAWLCPVLPPPDAGHTAIAGIYIAPWRAALNPHYDYNPASLRGASEYAITAREIFPIAPAAPTAPLNPENLTHTLEKLRTGQPVTIAFMGDSITLGAEATRWWEDRYDANSTPWKGRLIHALRQRFPSATIEVIEAYRGGVTIAYGLERIADVLSRKPDLVIAAFGANDADGDTGRPPRTSPEAFATALASLADQSRAAGSEILFVTTFPLQPWLRSGAAHRLEHDHIPALKKTAAEHHAAVADVHTDYKNLNTRGIPYWSQNHNGVNHPGDLGHQLYADTVLRCFPASP